MSERCAFVPYEGPLGQRTSAFHHSIVFLSETVPNIGLMTYKTLFPKEANVMIMLAKLIFGFGEDEITWIRQDNITHVTCKNIDGGLRGTGKCNGISYEVEAFPLVSVNGPDTRHGGMVIRFRVDSGKAFVRLGGGDVIVTHKLHDWLPDPDKESWRLSDDKVHCSNGRLEWKNHKPMIISTQHPVVLYGGDSVSWTLSEDSAVGVAQGGVLELTLGFSTDPAEAERIAGFSPSVEREKVESYYHGMFENWSLDTPWESLNETFRHARLNVEYSWVAPYGWTETIHHYPCMWHMQHTVAEEWAGNADRSLSTLREQLKALLPNGAVPCLDAGGSPRRDYGGDNQFFFRGVWHYLKMTNDLDFAKEVESGLETVLQQTFRQCDPCMSGIISWGLQLGNQEDFESTPGYGAASGFEGAEMLHIMSEVKLLLGKEEESACYAGLSALVCAKVRDELWLKDVGRLAWFKDSQGELRLDPPYHALVDPVLYDQFNDYEKVCSLDHLLHRMSGAAGEMYVSNHFGEHAFYGNPTWGMQCGSAMQPFAAMAYAAIGKNNDAIRPLQFIADIVTGPYQRGSFPESANEPAYSYYSPSAAMWSQGIIEAIFGLKADRTRGTMTIAPCLPDDWDHASLTIPGIRIAFCRNGSVQSYVCRFSTEETRTFLLRLPPYAACSVRLNGCEVKSHTDKHLGWFELSVPVGTCREFTLEVDYAPMQTVLDFPKCLAEGSVFTISADNAEILSVSDPAGLLRESRQNAPCSFTLTLRPDLLEPYEKFGWFGLVNFARRTLILTLRAENVVYNVPVTFVVIPSVVAEGHYDGKALSVIIDNNTGSTIKGPVSCHFYGEFFLVSKESLPGGRTTLTLPISKAQRDRMVLGKNTATLLYHGKALDFAIESEVTEYEALSVSLPKDRLVPAAYWTGMCGRLDRNRTHMLTGPTHYFMNALFETQRQLDILPGLPVRLEKEGFLPLDSEKHRYVTLDLNGVRARKLYLLVSTIITQHNIFGRLLRIEAECTMEDEAYMRPIFIKDLCFPGDLDMGFSGRCTYGFPTYVEEEPHNGRPALPTETGTDDYVSAMPPAYPQHNLWSRNRTTEVCDTVFNLIEIDLQKTRSLKELRIIVMAAETSAGVYAISLLQ